MIIINIIITIIAYRDTYPSPHHMKLKETISTVILALFYSSRKRRNEIKYFYKDLNKQIYILAENFTVPFEFPIPHL